MSNAEYYDQGNEGLPPVGAPPRQQQTPVMGAVPPQNYSGAVESYQQVSTPPLLLLSFSNT